MNTSLSTRAQNLRALQDLLLSLFRGDLDGLRYLLRGLDGYEGAKDNIPNAQGLAPAVLMRTTVDWLEEAGLVRGVLFDALIRKAPARENEIREVQRLLQRVVLFLTATPPDLEPLDVERDAAGMEKALYASFADPGWAVVVQHRVSLDDLIPAMLRYKPDVLHFSGHGDLWGRILVEGEEGADQVPSAALLRLMSSATPPLQCVMWSACHSSRLAAATVKAGVPCAIGMTDSVADPTAIEVAKGFYFALAQRREGTYAQALEMGRLQADLSKAFGQDIPQFYGDPSQTPRAV